jgi:hypothetical protein
MHVKLRCYISCFTLVGLMTQLPTFWNINSLLLPTKQWHNHDTNIDTGNNLRNRKRSNVTTSHKCGIHRHVSDIEHTINLKLLVIQLITISIYQHTTSIRSIKFKINTKNKRSSISHFISNALVIQFPIFNFINIYSKIKTLKLK